jgi:phosphatidylglycerol:prolipoprotein diacylglycerol transferase
MNHWVWNVAPDIIQLGPLRLRWYGLFFALGFLFGYEILTRFYRHERRPVDNLSSLALYLMLGTIIGARLGHVLFYQPDYYFAHPAEIVKVWHGGLASHGGFVGVLIAIGLYLRKYRDMSFLQLADRLAIPSLLAASLIRVGNFFNSEILGTPSNLPWAIVFARVDNIPRHPAMLYESMAYFLVFCALYAAYWKTRIMQFPGRTLGVSLTVCFLARFLIEFVKEDQVPFERNLPLDMGQLLSIPFIVAGILLIYLSKEKSSQKLARPLDQKRKKRS